MEISGWDARYRGSAGKSSLEPGAPTPLLVLAARDLPPSVRGGRAAETQLLQRNDLTVKEAEKQLVMRALKETEGNRTLAAKKIGMSRRTFHRKLHAFHLEGF